MLGITACATDNSSGGAPEDSSSSSSNTEEGVAPGASKAEYIKAFEDVEPISLTTQTPGAKGTASASYSEDYAAALEEWSGGKITMEVGFGNSIVPPGEAESALMDGRLSMDRLFPVYEPSKYPATAEFSNITFLGNQSPIFGSLSSTGAFMDLAFRSEAMKAEMEGKGVKPLLAYAPQTSNNLMCTEPLTNADDLKGLQVRVSTSGVGEQATATGLTPVSMPYGEVYEGLQRGAIDCLIGQVSSFHGLGVTEVAPYLHVTDKGGFSRTPNVVAFSQVVWDSMPLVAQQLVWDRLDVFIESQFKNHVGPSTVDAVEALSEGENTILELPAEAATELASANEQMLEEASNNLDVVEELGIDGVEELVQDWEGWVSELGYPDDSTEDLGKADAELDLDFAPYTELLQEKVLNEHRPR